MKKVIVSNRSVYHKYAEVMVGVPNHVKDEDVSEWLMENEHLYTDALDENLSKAEYQFGLGLSNGMDELESESETRYDVLDVFKENRFVIGGHL